MVAPATTAEAVWDPAAATNTKVKNKEFLKKLFQRVLEFPTLQVPGLSALEQQGQELVGQYISQPTPTGVTTALEQLQKTVSGGYDPYSSPEYQGYRVSSKLEENEAINTLRRILQKGGVSAGSSPALSQQGKVMQGYSADRMQYLGNLLNQERTRQLGAAGQLASLSETEAERPLRYAAAAEQFGAIPREIETKQNEALYNAIVQTMLAPYQYQAPIATKLRELAVQKQLASAGSSDASSAMLGQAGGSGLSALITKLFGGGAAAGTAAAAPTTLASGDALMTALSAIMAASDVRLKENIKPLKPILDNIDKIQPVTFKFKGKLEQNIGLIAQDVEKIAPEAVREIEGVKHIDYAAVVAILLKAIQELKLEVRGITEPLN